MAYLAVRGSGAVNGVSRLHAAVSRRLFEPLFARWPQADIPVGSVTNGVHMPTWDSAAADELWTQTCGKDRWLGPTAMLEQHIRRASDTSLWAFRNAARRSLVDYARERLSRQLTASGAAARTSPARAVSAGPPIATSCARWPPPPTTWVASSVRTCLSPWAACC